MLAGVVLVSVATLVVIRPARDPGPELLVGLTHTRFSADAWNDPGSVAKASGVLDTLDLQNQFIMGWGVPSPEPAPGEYDWTALDERVDLMRRSGRPMVLTLCCAPDWMKGGEAGQTDWSRIDEAPLPAHYKAFADLAAAVASRYPDVRYFQVWSELRGFYDRAANTWDMAAYTRLYNLVYEAIKGVAPTAQVGGPYVVIDSWRSPGAGGHPSSLKGPWGVIDARSLYALSYWLQHAVGAEFVSVDGGLAPRDAEPPTPVTVAVDKLVTLDSWLATQTDLPIWWSELHMDAGGSPQDEQPTAAATVVALQALETSGARVALLWCGERCGPDDSAPGLWTRTDQPGGGLPTLIMRDVWAVLGRTGAS